MARTCRVRETRTRPAALSTFMWYATVPRLQSTASASWLMLASSRSQRDAEQPGPGQVLDRPHLGKSRDSITSGQRNPLRDGQGGANRRLLRRRHRGGHRRAGAAGRRGAGRSSLEVSTVAFLRVTASGIPARPPRGQPPTGPGLFASASRAILVTASRAARRVIGIRVVVGAAPGSGVVTEAVSAGPPDGLATIPGWVGVYDPVATTASMAATAEAPTTATTPTGPRALLDAGAALAAAISRRGRGGEGRHHGGREPGAQRVGVESVLDLVDARGHLSSWAARSALRWSSARRSALATAILEPPTHCEISVGERSAP